ncbi:MAG TPA: lactonase family protein [Rhizomicrobium sp.]|jgi:6-phosphogluconolactonase (cycloisomerase 2 family)|nr:lactonase family protein [Rhizomicrobium sp.]
MKFLTTVAAAALILGSAHAAFAARAYIGTYTKDPAAPRPSGNGEGIYLADIDEATGAPSHLRLMVKALSPSWITLSADHKFLYAVNEIASYGPNKSGSVTAYSVNPATGALKQLNVVDSGGSIPCYAVVHPSGKFLLVANYTGGSYAVIPIKPDGSLGAATDVVKPEGPMGVYNAKDKPPGMFGSMEPHGSRGHMILPDPSGQYVLGADAGRDQIFVWKLDTNSGKLQQVSVTKSVPGAAPRHFAFSPDGKTLYQQQEQDSRLTVYSFANGKLTQKGSSISTLPAGFEGSNTTSELLIDKAGKHLYGANRNHDTIATMDVQPDGSVKLVANTHTEGTIPRSLTIDPTGKFLYSMNQGADNLTTFRLDANGVPRFTGKFLGIGSPAVMVFLP